METDSNKKESRYSVWLIIFVVIAIVKIVNYLIPEEPKPPKIHDPINGLSEAAKRSSEIFSEQGVKIYLKNKTEFLTAPFYTDSLGISENDIVKVLFDEGKDNDLSEYISITEDKLVSESSAILVGSQELPEDYYIPRFVDSIFVIVRLLKTQMDLYDGGEDFPKYQQLNVYVRTNNMKTYVKEVFYHEEDSSHYDQLLYEQYSLLQERRSEMMRRKRHER